MKRSINRPDEPHERAEPSPSPAAIGAGHGPAHFSLRRLERLIDDPTRWAVPAGRGMGLRFRIHIVFILLAGALLIRSFVPVLGEIPAVGPAIMVTALAALLLVVLLHELGHALTTRWAGGEANEIVLWPLGGLSTHRPPIRARDAMGASLGGPAVNFFLAAALLPALLYVGEDWRGLLFNPLAPAEGYSIWAIAAQPEWWMTFLWWVWYVNAVVGLANLAPMHPLNGARLLESVLAMGLEARRAASWTVLAGYASAVGLLVAALLGSQTILLFLAAFGWLCCTHRSRQLTFVDEVQEERDEARRPVERAGPSQRAGPSSAPAGLPDEASRPATLLDPAGTETDDIEIDRILAKISAEGLSSLTPVERRLLEEVTARRRRA